MNTYNATYEANRWCPRCEVGWAFQGDGDDCWLCGLKGGTAKPFQARYRNERLPGDP